MSTVPFNYEVPASETPLDAIHYIANTIECFTTDYRDITSIMQAAPQSVNHVIDLVLDLHILQESTITADNSIVPNTDGSIDAEGGAENNNGVVLGNFFTFAATDVADWKTATYGSSYANANSDSLSAQASLGFEKLFQKENLTDNPIDNGILISGTPEVKFIESKVATLLNTVANDAHLKIASNLQVSDVLNYVLRAGKRSIVAGKIQFQASDVLTMYVDVKDFDDLANMDRWEINLIHLAPGL